MSTAGPGESPFEVPSGSATHGVVRAPASKSHAIRLLVAAALSSGLSRVRGVPGGSDVDAVLGALAGLGFAVERVGDDVSIEGAGGALPNARAALDLRGSGTGLRILTALCALGPGPYSLDGDASLRARPVGAVAAAVRALGVSVETTDGCPPLIVRGGPVSSPPADVIEVDIARSSQPLSALGLVAAALPPPVRIVTSCPLAECASLGYVDLTRAVVEGLGGARWRTTRTEDGRGVHRIERLGFPAFEAEVEGDWSSAAFLLGAALASGGDVRVEGLAAETAQPDRRVTTLLLRMGGDVALTATGALARAGELRPIRVDLRGAPDLAPLVGALGCLAPGTTVVQGAAHLRIKESDRIRSVVEAARALGCPAEERADGFAVHGGAPRGGLVDPRGDHRIAMAFSLVGLAVPGVRIADPGCVAKSFPGFFRALRSLL